MGTLKKIIKKRIIDWIEKNNPQYKGIFSNKPCGSPLAGTTKRITGKIKKLKIILESCDIPEISKVITAPMKADPNKAQYKNSKILTSRNNLYLLIEKSRNTIVTAFINLSMKSLCIR